VKFAATVRAAINLPIFCMYMVPTCCAFADAPTAAGAAPPRVVYLSPTRDARLVLPQSNIVVRFDRAVDPTWTASGVLEVEGTLSGMHEGRTVLASDSRTLVFKPRAPFTWGERVTVRVGPPAESSAELATFSFSIAGSRPPRLPAELAEDPDFGRAGACLDCGDRLAQPFAATDSFPSGFPTITSAIYQTPASGRLFMGSFGIGANGNAAPFLLILDDFGRPIFERRMPNPCRDFKVQPNGELTYYDAGMFRHYVMDSSYTVIDSIACGNGYVDDTHELRILANGHALLMAYDPELVDMSAIVPGGDPSAIVTGLILQELDENKNVVFQWRSWDHFQITDATHEDLLAHTIDYVHGNAIEVDADGNLLLSCRHMDEITKIDRTTGDILWRWGGKNNQFTFLDDSIGFSHQHAIRLIDNGHYTMFDNGNFHTPSFSRAVEYVLDQTQFTAQLVWQYRNTPDSYGNAQGYVQRLPNGSTLIGWGTGKPDVIEVAANGTKVMELSLPANTVSYRAFRYEWMPEAPVLRVNNAVALSFSNLSPNPSRERSLVTFSLSEDATVSLKIYDVGGREVASVLDGVKERAGSHQVGVRLPQARPGLYFCRLSTGAHVEMRKLVLVR
jgi:Arylsulfotransferase (ASST)/Bacterial Ig-like domain